MDLEKTTVLSSELDKEKFGQTWIAKKVVPENQRFVQNIYSTELSLPNTEWFSGHSKNEANWCTLPLSRKSLWFEGKNRCNKGFIPKRRINKN